MALTGPKAGRHGLGEDMASTTSFKENNERDRVLSAGEYTCLLAHCPAHLKPIIKVAYYTGMETGGNP
jgi:hypothetical protein